MRALFAALLLLLGLPPAWAQSVSLQGMLGNRALLIVDGAAPKTVAPGESHKGVKVLSTEGDTAVVEIGGRRQTLRVGDAPASVAGSAPPAGGNRIVLTAGSGGHFVTYGTVNGRATQFLVDTGASVVGLGAGEAERLGIPWRSGQEVRMGTANGVVPGWRVRLASVRIGDVEVREVEGVVTQAPMPFILLGNSFLDRFRMRRDNDQMVLERRY
jgi:aspartyl protease family protein